jgi:hypothetical protein
MFITSFFVGSNGFDDRFIVPFKAVGNAQQHSSVTVIEEVFRETVDIEALWCPVEACSHEKWVTSLVCTILKTFPQENCFISQLVALCSVKVSIAQTRQYVTNLYKPLSP